MVGPRFLLQKDTGGILLGAPGIIGKRIRRATLPLLIHAKLLWRQAYGITPQMACRNCFYISMYLIICR